MSKSVLLALGGLAASANGNPFRAKPTQSLNSGKDAYISKLLEQAQSTRKLNDVAPDISGYSLQFQKCQFRKQFAVDECDDEEGCMEVKRFAIFKLCKSCSDCSYDYAEYLVDLESYLETTAQYYAQEQENYCKSCEEYCQNNNNRRKLQYDVNCGTCIDECYDIENKEQNGYLEASELLECQQISEDKYGNAYYAGPTCAGNGEEITIGVYTDEQCSVPAGMSPEELRDNDGYSIKLDYELLQKTYTNTCISCTQVDWDAQENEDNGNQEQEEEEEVEVTEACEALYELSAKCESDHGFDAGYNWYTINYGQAYQEETICSFIDNLKSSTYNSYGEINLSGEKSRSVTGKSAATGSQKIALAVLIFATVGLGVWAASLYSKLTGAENTDLSQQGGTMS